MKTTLVIDDTVMKRLREEAARQNRTLSDLVEAALRQLFRMQRERPDLPPLPRFRGGLERVNIANRDALYDAMEES